MFTLSSKVFSDLLTELFPENTKPEDFKVPYYDVIENEDNFILELILAGMKKENIEINTEKNNLIIKAERQKNEKLDYIRRESYFGIYKKTFILPDTVDLDNIAATMEDGILKIIIPKKINNTKISKSIEIK